MTRSRREIFFDSQFSVDNDAWQFHWKATHHYAAARCLLLHGHSFDGLIASQQAIEKDLKCAILLKQPHYNVQQHAHRIAELLPVIQQLQISDLSQFKSYADYLDRMYPVTRYPKSSTKPKRWSTDVDKLDEMMLTTQEIMPWPDDVFRYCSYGPFYQLCCRDAWGPLIPNTKWAGDDWAKPENKAWWKREKRVVHRFYYLWLEVYEEPPPGYAKPPPSPV